MAVPKRRTSRSNTHSRRSQWKATVPALARCKNGHVIRPHTACSVCGLYGDRQALNI